MKKLLPLIVVSMMIGLSTGGYAQWRGCMPRVMNLRQGNRVPVPLTPPRPIVPAFHYPPGVGPTMTNMPLPTRNPSYDVDVSSHRSSQLPELVQPTPAAPQRLRPIPAFSQKERQNIVSGKFVTISRKHDTAFATPGITIQEEVKEPVRGMTLEAPPVAPDVPLQIIGPLTPQEPLDNTSVESNSSGSNLDEEEEPAVVDIFSLEEDNEATEELNPFGSEEESDPFGDIINQEP